VQPRILKPNHLEIALENRHVRNVEAHDGGVQPYIRFGDVLAEEVRCAALAQVFLEAVEGGEDGVHVLEICVLGCREAGFVDAVVEVVVDPCVHFFDGGL
jgi:uncharacterized protein (DUF111 family)